jgi:Flp pilus assembly protein TadG
MKKLFQNRLKSRRGNALVEYAIASTVLIPIFLGTFQYGYAFYVYNLMSTQVRSGARYASLRTFRCGNNSSATAFKTAVKNVVRFGNPSGTGSVIEPGLQDNQISVSILDASGADADGTHTPSYVVVKAANYSVDAVVTTFTFNGKPSVTMPYLGQYAPAETE